MEGQIQELRLEVQSWWVAHRMEVPGSRLNLAGMRPVVLVQRLHRAEEVVLHSGEVRTHRWVGTRSARVLGSWEWWARALQSSALGKPPERVRSDVDET